MCQNGHHSRLLWLAGSQGYLFINKEILDRGTVEDNEMLIGGGREGDKISVLLTLLIVHKRNGDSVPEVKIPDFDKPF